MVATIHVHYSYEAQLATAICLFWWLPWFLATIAEAVVGLTE
jgi:hypothetical protein